MTNIKLKLDAWFATLKPELYAAIADTHRNGGDSTEIEAPFMSGSGAQSAIAQGQSR